MHLPSCSNLLRTALLPMLFVALAHAQDNGQKPALLQLASAFSDHMVLQRDHAITVWGRAWTGANVSVNIGELQGDAKARDGRFAVTLPALPANASASDLVVSAKLGNREQTVTLHDVLVGDLWLCTGQSNMRWRVNQSAEASEILAAADVKNLRVIDYEGSLYPTSKRYELDFLKRLKPENYYSTKGWQQASRESANTFSGVAFVFGRRLAREAGVPIGVIHNAIGGSPMAAFLPLNGSAVAPVVRKSMASWQAGDGYPAWCRRRVKQNLVAWFDKPTGQQPHHPFEPSFLFDAGIEPLKQLPIRGVVWYQGESDATDIPGNRPRSQALNHAIFTSLIASFRANWSNAELPFFFVQLPGLDRNWPTFREMQARVAKEDAHADMAVTIDVGHPSDVHPRRKVPVGDRLAQLALAQVYGQAVATSGPRFAKMRIDGARATVHFDHGHGLRTIDNKPVLGFSIAGSNKQFHPAIATIAGSTIHLRSAQVKQPVAVRYAFASDPRTNLVNNARLPAAPFRTDTWTKITTAAVTLDIDSFEEIAVGALETAASPQGKWQADKGHAEISKQFAHSGKQCLHLHGGEDRQATIALTQRGPRRISFVAERWTSRAPFTFRVEARIGSRWKEIYNGDKVRVGSRFLSQVEADLPKGVTALRFRSTTPAKSGVLIDDLQLADAVPMRVLGSQHRLWVAPALRGKTSPIAKIAIKTTGHNKPLSVTQVQLTFSNDTDLAGIAYVHALGQQKPASRTMVFEGKSALANGDNELAIAVDLTAAANLDSRVQVRATEVTLSNGETLHPDGGGTAQRIGVALRTAGQDNCHTYRIPGLATTNKGTLIAVYDNRYRGGGDLPGDVDVGMSRSTDGGATWEPMRVIMDMGNDKKWHYDGIGDPEVLVDTVNGRIWAGATWSHGNRSWNGSGPGMEPAETGQFMLVHSDDDGKTWSKPRNITKQIKDPKWRFVLQGPGAGITMRDGTLVLAAQYRSAPDGPHKGKPFSTLISSMDRGETWQIGTGAKVDTTEAQLVELEDGVLMINCRDNRRGSRSIYTTNDLGKTWTVHATSRHGLIEPTCMASLLRVDHKELGRLLVFSNPNTAAGRFDMTLKVSTDDGATWPARWHTRYDQRPGAGYSCLTQVDNEHVGVVYEGRRELYYLRFPIRELLTK
ncbi:MAG: sialidase-1 [Planctomycetota bacterium]|jgi:sialidase-1